ncbi:MAG: hypothetical protein KDH96_12640, partial [Candidatus Riesia sp.]|nr:hypothetical protein [Candidatus Riesia sp.]
MSLSNLNSVDNPNLKFQMNELQTSNLIANDGVVQNLVVNNITADEFKANWVDFNPQEFDLVNVQSIDIQYCRYIKWGNYVKIAISGTMTTISTGEGRFSIVPPAGYARTSDFTKMSQCIGTGLRFNRNTGTTLAMTAYGSVGSVDIEILFDGGTLDLDNFSIEL